MVSADPRAVSAILSASPAASATATGHWTAGVFYVRKPDLNDETRRLIGRHRAADAWDAYWDLLRDQERRGRGRRRHGDTDDEAAKRTAAVRDAAGRGILDVGIGALARRAGISAKAMRRQVAAIEAIGLWVTFRPNTTISRDATGRIVRKVTGRTPPVRIHLTLTEGHLRPASRGKKVSITANRLMDTFAPTSIPPVQTSLDEKPTPATGIEAGLPAGETGRHSAAKASLGEGCVLAVNVNADGITVTEAEDRGATSLGEEHRPPPTREEPCEVVHHRPQEASGRQEMPTPARSTSSPIAGRYVARGRPTRGTGMTGGSWKAEYLDLLAARQAELSGDRPPDRPVRSISSAREMGDDERLLQAAIERRLAEEGHRHRVESQAKATSFRDAYHEEMAGKAVA